HAEVFAEAGRWFIRDCDTMNGTRLNGERIQQPRPLEHGHIIGIGNTRLRFALTDDDSNGRTPHQADQARGLQPADLSHAALCADELTALCHFMAVCVEENDPRELVLLALRTLHRQTGATLTGFLSLDEDPGLPKIVFPETAQVDVPLSQRLTLDVQKQGR